MRIGLMLRHYEQHGGGLKVHTHSLLPHILSMDSKNHYTLMYYNPDLIGTFSHFSNVDEMAFPLPGKIMWDQFAVPVMAKKKRIDLIFNPKFTVPILSKARKVFVFHGAEWFVIPESYLWLDRWYSQKVVPLYCRSADAVIATSHNTKRDVVKFTGVDSDKVIPIYNGFNHDRFRLIRNSKRLKEVKQRYNLQDPFIFWVSQIYPPKNVGRLLQAFWKISSEIPHQLVITGQPAWKADQELRPIKDLGIQDRVNLTGWVSDEDLPVIYNLADLFAFPSLYEGFGIPLLEAMACGCPVLTSNIGSPPEVVDNAGYLVNPLDVEDIANGILKILLNNKLREKMTIKGLERAKRFSWERCAKEVLEVFKSLEAK